MRVLSWDAPAARQLSLSNWDRARRPELGYRVQARRFFEQLVVLEMVAAGSHTEGLGGSDDGFAARSAAV